MRDSVGTSTESPCFGIPTEIQILVKTLGKMITLSVEAFDTIDRSMLFKHIWDKGIQGKAWRLIHMLYRKVENKVIFGRFESNTYEVLNGVKQGCILSPCLFNLAMIDLHDMLQECNGIDINGSKVHSLFYADDIVLMAQNEKSLLHMLKQDNLFSRKWGLKFNERKSQVLIIGKRVSDKK